MFLDQIVQKKISSLFKDIIHKIGIVHQYNVLTLNKMAL